MSGFESMSEFERVEGLEQEHDIANAGEANLLAKIKRWRESGCNFSDLADVEFIFGELTYLVEKEDHKLSPELLDLLRENRLLLSVNSYIKTELDKILDKTS